MMKIIVELS